MKYQIITFLFLALIFAANSGCNNGRPIVSEAINIEITREFVLDRSSFNNQIGPGIVENNRKIMSKPPGPKDTELKYGDKWDPDNTSGVFDLIPSTYNIINAVIHDTGKIDCVLRLTSGTTVIETNVMFTKNRIPLDENMIQNIRANGMKIELVVNGMYDGYIRRFIPPINSPHVARVLLAKDGNIYLNDFVIQ